MSLLLAPLALAALPAQVEAPLEPERLAALARAYVDERAAADAFSGTVLIAHGDEVLLEGAWGLRDRARELPMELETPITLGSITKVFTSAAIGPIVEAGGLDYETLVGEVLPEYPNQAVRETVRVRHLLTHSSGIPDYWRYWSRARRDQVRDVPSDLRLIAKKRLEFEPGREVRYRNSGVVVLGAMIEAVSGQDDYAYVREHVYAPADMRQSDHFEIDAAQVAVGYVPAKGGKCRPGTRRNPVVGSPADGSFSTAGDLWRFTRALRAGELISLETVELHTTAKVELEPGVGYGYLFFDIGTGERRWFGHGGGSEGVNAEWRVLPTKDYTMLVLANLQYAADEIAGHLAELVGRT